MIGLNGKPTVKPLLTLLNEWLEFRMNMVRNRLKHRLEYLNARLHILDGLLKAYLNIDKIIDIIRKEDKPKEALMKRFKLSEEQANAILDIKLRQLAKLEEMKIKDEQAELSKERDEIDKLLGSKAKLKTLIKKEIQACIEEFGDERNSPIVERAEAQAIREQDIRPNDPVTIVLSKLGWVRAGKGHDLDPASLNYKSSDSYLVHAHGRTNEQAVVLDSTGRSYSISPHKLPSARSQGEPITRYLKPPSGASFSALLAGKQDDQFAMASSAGYGFVTTLENLYCKNRSGKTLIKVPENATVLQPQRVQDYDSQYIVAATNTGHLLVFPLADLPLLARGKGHKIINIPSASVKNGDEFCVGIAIIAEKQGIVVYSGKRSLKLKPKDLNAFQGERAQRGKLLPRGLRRVTSLEAMD